MHAAHPPSDSPVYLDPIPPTTHLTEQNFSDVVDFTCARSGEKETRWEKDVSDWIKDRGPDGALAAIREGGIEVFLYLDENGLLIGYTSLSTQRWVDEETAVLLGAVYTLPYLAIHTNFRGQKVPSERRYGRRLLGGLIEEVERRAEYPWFFLYVDHENPAIDTYRLFGLQKHGQADYWTDPTDGRKWVVMKRPVPAKK